jgi:hypothetical protein
MLTKKTYIIRCTEEEYSKICRIISSNEIVVTNEKVAALISSLGGELSEVKKKMLTILLTDPDYKNLSDYTPINVTKLGKKVGVSQSTALCGIGDLVVAKILEKDYHTGRIKQYRFTKQVREFLFG